MHKISVIPRPQSPEKESTHKISVIPRPQNSVYREIEPVAEPDTTHNQDTYDQNPSDVVLGELAAHFFLNPTEGYDPMTDEVPSDGFQIDELPVDIARFE